MSDKAHQRWLRPLATWLARIAGIELAAVSARVDDSAGWSRYGQRPHERSIGEYQKLYDDALAAWRKNPIAKRIVDITTDFVVGDGITLSAEGQALNRFVTRWWHHPQNNMDLRVADLCDELARAGDLFISLHRNPEDGISYARPVPKDLIVDVETAANDWEREIAYYEAQPIGDPRKWLSPHHPAAADSQQVMLHYAVNRVIGASLGESDLASMLVWLRRYSHMLEDRVRLHWAVRAFLWMVTVPTKLVDAKKEMYSSPPESGTVIVKDHEEHWSPVTPLLRAGDAANDLKAVKRMASTASGFPPHWMSDPENINLATAQAMTEPAVRHLRRRQLYVRHLLQDMAYWSALRAWQIGKLRARPERARISVELPDISRGDNLRLASAARQLAAATRAMREQMGAGRSPTFERLTLALMMRFLGEPLNMKVVEDIVNEFGEQ